MGMMQGLNPDSLIELCLQYVVNNTVTVLKATGDEETSSSNVTGGDDDVSLAGLRLPTSLVDNLLMRFSERDKLDDASLLLVMGRPSRSGSNGDGDGRTATADLKCVRLTNCARVTERGLHSLRAHHIERLAAIGCRTTVRDLVRCLGSSTLNGLTSLDVSWTKHLDGRSKFVLNRPRLAICLLNNLRVLNVSHTKMDDGGLRDIAEHLPLLEILNISSTKVTDISPLLRCRDHLRALRMYNLRACDDDVTMAVLVQLEELRVLDVSIERPDPQRMFVSETMFRARLLIQQRGDPSSSTLPHLEVLDISGRKDITLDILRSFLECHPKLRFLGLMQTELCSCHELLTEYQNLKVTGNFAFEQVTTALQCYKDRPQFIEESMNFLLRESQVNPKILDGNIDIMSVILPNLMLYPKKLTLLLVTTGFVGNVLTHDMRRVEPKMLAKIVDNLMVAMENYPTHTKLQENVLIALHNENIFAENVLFDHRKCGRLVLNCFQHFDIDNFDAMTIDICHMAARMMLMRGETSSLAARRAEIVKMLALLRRKVQQHLADDLMMGILKSLGNLTCNTPENGLMFLEEGGMDVFYDIMEAFSDVPGVMKGMFPTTHSIALFEHLRPYLAHEKFINKIIDYLWHSEDFEIVFHAAGDLTLLAMEDNEAWRAMKPGSRETTLDSVFERLKILKSPEVIPFRIRSFAPGYHMLNPAVPYQAQLWILRTIYIFCKSNSPRYSKILASENGHILVENLMVHKDVHPYIRQCCQDILDLLRSQFYIP